MKLPYLKTMGILLLIPCFCLLADTFKCNRCANLFSQPGAGERCPSCYSEDITRAEPPVPSGSTLSARPRMFISWLAQRILRLFSRQTVVMTPTRGRVSDAYTQRAIALFLGQAQSAPDENLAISPEAIFQTLSLLLCGNTSGAQSQSIQSLAQWLGGCCHEGSSQQGSAYSSGCAAVVSGAGQFQSQYCREVHSRGAWAGPLAEARRAIQRQFREPVRGSLVNALGMVTAGSPGQAHVGLISGMHFAEKWNTPFEEKEGTFLVPGGTSDGIDLPMLSGEVSGVRLSEYQDWSAASIPYQGDYEMVLVLPPPDTLPSTVSPEIFTHLLSELTAPFKPVPLVFPGFTIDCEADLRALLRAQGLDSLFDSSANNFPSIIRNALRSYLRQFLQRCKITVDKEGTRLSVVTFASMIAELGEDPAFRVHRPFLFLIRKRSTGQILCLGQIIHPEELQSGQGAD